MCWRYILSSILDGFCTLHNWMQSPKNNWNALIYEQKIEKEGTTKSLFFEYFKGLSDRMVPELWARWDFGP